MRNVMKRRMFDVLEIEGIKKPTARIGNNEVKFYLPIDVVYDAIEAAHVAVGHSDRERLLVEARK